MTYPGFAKLYNDWTNDPFFEGDGVAWALFTRLVGIAKWKNEFAMHNKTRVMLKRGQVFTSIRELAEHLNFGKNVIAKRLTALKEEGLIEMCAGHRGTIISICNYNEIYEKRFSTRDTAGHRRDTDGTLTGTLTGTAKKSVNIGKYSRKRPMRRIGKTADGTLMGAQRGQNGDTIHKREDNKTEDTHTCLHEESTSIKAQEEMEHSWERRGAKTGTQYIREKTIRQKIHTRACTKSLRA